MKLIYTDIRTPLTTLLAREAEAFARAGKRVFYIAPNSLSFEKERAILQLLETQASFDIMVTRFAQLARYFVLNDGEEKLGIDDVGLEMVFFRVLSQMEDSSLQVYGKMRRDMQWIRKVAQLYVELQESNLSLADLEALDAPEKVADLQLIFSRVAQLLREKDYASQTKIARFTSLVASGKLAKELKDVVVIIDGFTRFSGEEQALIAALHDAVAEVVIGVYASQKAYRSSYIEGNLYQESVTFLRDLAETFATKPIFLEGTAPDALGKLSQKLEQHYDFSPASPPLSSQDVAGVTIWEASNQKEELEALARAIRQQLQEGYRYKDILVLLGDVEAYALQIGQVFDKYEIPYYIGKAEEMSHHPLVHFVESLERLKRYRFRAEDVVHLLKSGLYGAYGQEEIDAFEQYVTFADLQGPAAFAKAFTINTHGRYDLERLNQMREQLLTPLLTFLKPQKEQTAVELLRRLTDFLEEVGLTRNLQKLALSKTEAELEKEEEVWKAFCHILELIQTIFGQEKLTLDDFLALLGSGMQASHYRIVPATVDVVAVKSYDLIAPHAAPLVYALGMGPSHFPKKAQNTSLLTDEERLLVNEGAQGDGRLSLASQENLQRNHFTFLSLINAATQHLILSTPQLFQELEEGLSPYLKLLLNLGVKKEEKGYSTSLSPYDIGNYKGLLSRVIAANRLDMASLSKEEETFWSVAVRYLRKRLEKEKIEIPAITTDPEASPLSDQALAVLYPAQEPLVLSASSVTDFYRNEYLYFIRHMLRLQEQESIHPDARTHGNFLHRIFERVMTDPEGDFDKKLQRAIVETRQEPIFESIYQKDAAAQFSESLLLDVAQATSLVLRDDSLVRVLADEASFGEQEEGLFQLANGRKLLIRGKIDRLDALKADDALGIVDYKSSANQFKIDRFYNGLSPQLVTYIAAIKGDQRYSSAEKIFGAMYLHMLDPIVTLADVSDATTLLAEAQKSLVYRGLFLEEESHQLNHYYDKRKASLFQEEELATLLDYNQLLYQGAAEKILSGHLQINPYTEDGKTVAGEQLKAITGFEANLHLSQARQLLKGGKKEEWLQRMREGGKKA